MKEKIKNEYNIDVDGLISKPNYVMFQIDNNYFYLTKIRRNEQEVKELMEMYTELIQKNYPVNTIIPTKNGNLFLQDDKEYYILIMVVNPLEEYSLTDMIKTWDKLVLTNRQSVLYRPDWGSLWSEKIDYFEYQIRELGKDKPVVLNTFGYFVGLTENAICYVNKVNKTLKPANLHLVLCHRRVWYPNYRLNYNNPLQFVIDLEVRDVAEYLKGMALEDINYALIDLQTYLKIRKLDVYSLSMLYARLLYPSYYFDLYEDVMNFEVDEDCLLKILEKIDDIELFLKKSYEIISNFGLIEPVTWIMKKEVTN